MKYHNAQLGPQSDAAAVEEEESGGILDVVSADLGGESDLICDWKTEPCISIVCLFGCSSQIVPSHRHALKLVALHIAVRPAAAHPGRGDRRDLRYTAPIPNQQPQQPTPSPSEHFPPLPTPHTPPCPSHLTLHSSHQPVTHSAAYFLISYSSHSQPPHTRSQTSITICSSEAITTISIKGS